MAIKMMQNLLILMISPKMGWEYIDDSNHSTDQVLGGLFFPMLAILAVSCFVPMIYDSATHTISTTLIDVVVSFSKYLLTYFVTSFLLSGFYPVFSLSKIALTRLNNYIIYNLSFLVVLEIISKIINADFSPLHFMMLYVLFLIGKGTEMLGIKSEKRIKFIIFAGVLTLGLPYLFQWIMHLVINR